MKKSQSLIRWSILAVTAIALIVFFPVPSANSPNTRLEINSTCNRLSARVAEFGALSVPSVLHEIKVQDATLTAVYDNKGKDNKQGLLLTFQNDNIIALGFRLFILIIAYFILFVRQYSMGRILFAILSAPAIFATLLVVRNFFFGSYLALACSVEFIKLLDDPIRIMMLVAMLLLPMVILDKKWHRCKA